MKSNRITYGVMVGTTLAALLVVLSGCGMTGKARDEIVAQAPPQAAEKAASSKEEAEVPTTAAGPTHLAETLNPRLVYAGAADPSLPDGAYALDSRRAEDRMVPHLDLADFVDLIQLPTSARPRARFLVWSANWLGGKITRASYEHRMENELNNLASAPDRREAHFDPETNRWFIPVAEFVMSGSVNAVPHKAHILSLDLVLNSGERKLVRVRMRVTGEVLRLTQTRLETLGDLSALLGTGETVLERVLFVNPVDRPVQFWVRGEGRLAMETAVSRTSWAQTTDRRSVSCPNPRGPGFPWNTRYVATQAPVRQPSEERIARASMQVAALEVRRPSGVTRYNPAEWRQLTLAPRERIELVWLSSVARCALPAPVSQHFEWWIGETDCSNDSLHINAQNEVSAWQVDGRRLSGSWRPEYRFLEEWEDAGGTTGFEDTQPRFVGLGSGNVNSGLAAWDCEGIL